jgi:hypothetical protein
MRNEMTKETKKEVRKEMKEGTQILEQKIGVYGKVSNVTL